MAFSVTAYKNFRKAKNSTKTPSEGSSHDTFSCVLKESSPILSPVLAFDFPGGASYNPVAYNYFYIGAFGRYYFIVDWSFSGGLWWAELTVDVMASWKSDIYADRQYVVRSANTAIQNVAIVDNAYPATYDIDVRHDQLSLYEATNMKGGVYVMGIADGKRFSRGGITYYCGTQSDFSQLFKFLYGTTDWLGGPNITDISNDLLKCLIDPGQYIKSLMWFPFGMSLMSEEGGDAVGAGWWETDVHLMYTHSTVEKSATATRHYHPQGPNAKSYLNYAPYTAMEVYVPGFGKVPLPPEKFAPGHNVKFNLNVDTVTGTGTLFVHQENLGYAEGIVLKGQIGITVAVTTFVSDMLGAVSSVGNTIGNIGMGNIVSGAIGTISGIADAAKQLSPDVTVVGGNGNCSEYKVPGLMNTRFKKLVAFDGAHLGYPVCQTVTLGSYAGFTVVADPDINYNCYDSEKDIIANYMKGGFYIE